MEWEDGRGRGSKGKKVGRGGQNDALIFLFWSLPFVIIIYGVLCADFHSGSFFL